MRNVFHLIQKLVKLQNQSFPCIPCGTGNVGCTVFNQIFQCFIDSLIIAFAIRHEPCSTSPTRLHGPIALKNEPHLHWAGTDVARAKESMQWQPTQHFPM